MGRASHVRPKCVGERGAPGNQGIKVNTRTLPNQRVRHPRRAPTACAVVRFLVPRREGQARPLRRFGYGEAARKSHVRPKCVGRTWGTPTGQVRPLRAPVTAKKQGNPTFAHEARVEHGAPGQSGDWRSQGEAPTFAPNAWANVGHPASANGADGGVDFAVLRQRECRDGRGFINDQWRARFAL
jgi:hypothetical protein